MLFPTQREIVSNTKKEARDVAVVLNMTVMMIVTEMVMAMVMQR